MEGGVSLGGLRPLPPLPTGAVEDTAIREDGHALGKPRECSTILMPVLRRPGAEPQHVVGRGVVPGGAIGRPSEIRAIEPRGQLRVILKAQGRCRDRHAVARADGIEDTVGARELPCRECCLTDHRCHVDPCIDLGPDLHECAPPEVDIEAVVQRGLLCGHAACIKDSVSVCFEPADGRLAPLRVIEEARCFKQRHVGQGALVVGLVERRASVAIGIEVGGDQPVHDRDESLITGGDVQAGDHAHAQADDARRPARLPESIRAGQVTRVRDGRIALQEDVDHRRPLTQTRHEPRHRVETRRERGVGVIPQPPLCGLTTHGEFA